jgi:methyl-accepting chemotaxis protein
MSDKLTTVLGRWINTGYVFISQRDANWRKRKTYVVDRQLQLEVAKHVAILVVMTSALVLSNIYVLWNLMEVYNSSLTIGDYSLWSDGAIWLYGLSALVCNSGIFVLLILFHSHRIAGPLIKIVRSLHQLAEGDLRLNIRLRKRDYLKEIAHAVNEVVDEWNTSIGDIRQAVESLKCQPGETLQKANLEKKLAALEGTLDRYKLKKD